MDCSACRLGKAHRITFPGHFSDAKKVGAIVNSYIEGKIEPYFPHRFTYVSTFLDVKYRTRGRNDAS